MKYLKQSDEFKCIHIPIKMLNCNYLLCLFICWLIQTKTKMVYSGLQQTRQTGFILFISAVTWGYSYKYLFFVSFSVLLYRSLDPSAWATSLFWPSTSHCSSSSCWVLTKHSTSDKGRQGFTNCCNSGNVCPLWPLRCDKWGRKTNSVGNCDTVVPF